jgi:hypothetical protein
MNEIQMTLAWTKAYTDRWRAWTRHRTESDTGGGIVEYVIIVGLVAAAAIVIVAILVTKARTAANNVQTQ